jgi:hypothetical protein
MTGTVNGIGTHLSGVRDLTDEEIKKWAEKIPYIPNVRVQDYKIATESFVLLFLPIIPIKTYIFYYLDKGLINSQYRIVYYPSGEETVYWEHVKKSPIFYISPAIILIIILWLISGGI